MWPQSETWGGNVQFVDNQTLIIDCPHWERLRTKDKLPDGFTVHTRWIGRDAPEQNLPRVPKSQASFDGAHGVDQNGDSFNYRDGKLFRDDRLIVDLGVMMPDPQPSPGVAHTW